MTTHHQSVNRKFSTIYYETLGSAANPCIVLINGLGGQLISWPLAFTEGLASLGFYVVVFDNRDAGLSKYYNELGIPDINEAMKARQEGKSFDPPYNLENMAADVIHLMDELKIEKAHIMGISMGGMIAQLVAFGYKERVISLTCIATTSGNPNLPPAKQEVLSYFFSAQNSEDDVDSYVNNRVKLYKIYSHSDHFNEERARDLFKKLYNRAYNPNGIKRQLSAMIATGSLVEKLKKIQIPSLIIHGDCDPAFSVEHGKELAEIIVNSRLEIIPKMGHGLPGALCKKLVDICGKFYNSLRV